MRYLIPGIHDGLLGTIFTQSWLDLKIFGFPTSPAYGQRLTLIDIIILVVIAYLVNLVTEKLTGKKVGSMFKATVITLFGAWLMIAFVNLPGSLGFAVEDVPIIAALLGAIIVGVFYNLIKAQMGKGKGGGH